MTGCCCCCITGLQSAGPQVGTQGAGPEAACPQGPQGAGSGPHGPQGLIPQGVIDVIVWPILGIIPMMGRGGPIIAGTGGKVCGIWPSGPGTKPSTHCHDMAATSAAHTTSLCQKNIVKYHEETTLNCSPFKSNGIEVCLMFVFANSNKNNETKSKTVTATESQATHSNPVQRSVAPVVGHVAFLDVFLDVFLGVSRFSLLASQVDSSEEREEERAR